MDSLEQNHAKPGDTIEVTCKETAWFGKQIIVIPPPGKIINPPQPGDAWISEGFIRLHHYKIIKRLSQDTKSVDAFLQDQLDANMGDIFC